jgi:hypothetical protein
MSDIQNILVEQIALGLLEQKEADWASDRPCTASMIRQMRPGIGLEKGRKPRIHVVMNGQAVKDPAAMGFKFNTSQLGKLARYVGRKEDLDKVAKGRTERSLSDFSQQELQEAYETYMAIQEYQRKKGIYPEEDERGQLGKLAASSSEKQRGFMGAELQRKREGKATRTGMSESDLEDFASLPLKKKAGSRGGKISRRIVSSRRSQRPKTSLKDMAAALVNALTPRGPDSKTYHPAATPAEIKKTKKKKAATMQKHSTASEAPTPPQTKRTTRLVQHLQESEKTVPVVGGTDKQDLDKEASARQYLAGSPAYLAGYMTKTALFFPRKRPKMQRTAPGIGSVSTRSQRGRGGRAARQRLVEMLEAQHAGAFHPEGYVANNPQSVGTGEEAIRGGQRAVNTAKAEREALDQELYTRNNRRRRATGAKGLDIKNTLRWLVGRR